MAAQTAERADRRVVLAAPLAYVSQLAPEVQQMGVDVGAFKMPERGFRVSGLAQLGGLGDLRFDMFFQ